MKYAARLFIIPVTLLLLLLSVPSQAQQWSDSQSQLWDYVVQSWEDDTAKNGKWPAEYTHPLFVAWGSKDPAPRNRSETISWNRAQETSGNTVVWYKVTPMSIVIEGETAVVMYYSDLLNEDKEGKRKRDASRIVEVFVRDGNGWKFLSSTGFKLEFEG